MLFILLQAALHKKIARNEKKIRKEYCVMYIMTIAHVKAWLKVSVFPSYILTKKVTNISIPPITKTRSFERIITPPIFWKSFFYLLRYSNILFKIGISQAYSLIAWIPSIRFFINLILESVRMPTFILSLVVILLIKYISIM